jgi:geranylgeranyl pyrophosphate synthase
MSTHILKYTKLYKKLEESIDFENAPAISLNVNNISRRKIEGFDVGIQIEKYTEDHKPYFRPGSILYNNFNHNKYYNLGFDVDEAQTQVAKTDYKTLSKILGNNGVAGGQLLDLTYTDKNIKNLYNNNSVDLKEMIAKKTGAFFEISFLLGWLFGGGDNDSNKIEHIKKISEYFSLIYQILDDLEDVSEDKSPKNFVIKYGKEKSIEYCLENINKFKNEMINLEIYSDYFQEVMKYMEKKLDNFI